MNITKQTLLEELRSLGLAEGDHVMMHSSLSSFGNLEGGADTLLDAVLEIVGDEGTLLLPTLTYDGSITLFLRKTQEMDLRTARSFMGRVTETARLRSDFVRSIHPTHPVVAKGKRAADLMGEHHLGDSAVGEKSPYAKLSQIGNGKVLLIGVDHNKNTLIHAAEEYYTPYIFNGEIFNVKTTATDGEIYDVAVKGYCIGTHRNFQAVQPYLEKAGFVQQRTIGNSVVSLVQAKGLMETLQRLLTDDPNFLLAR
ncbi:MAG: AAC(3) family N-acetyltransferase, partial [Abditibacteriaceae bacterium]